MNFGIGSDNDEITGNQGMCNAPRKKSEVHIYWLLPLSWLEFGQKMGYVIDAKLRESL